MKTSTTLIVMMAMAGFVMPLQAALIINNGDIVSNHYVYSLTYDDMSTTMSPLKFENDAWSLANFSTINEGTAGARFVQATAGETTAELIYKFDFSATQYRPTAVSVRDIFLMWNFGEEGATATSAWSLDNVTYNEISTGVTYGTDHVSKPLSMGGTDVIPLSQPSVFYYKFTVAVNQYDVDGVFTGPWNLVHWNREDSGQTYYFNTDFTVTPIPEPSVFALIGLGATGLCCFRKKHDKRNPRPLPGTPGNLALATTMRAGLARRPSRTLNP